VHSNSHSLISLDAQCGGGVSPHKSCGSTQNERRWWSGKALLCELDRIKRRGVYGVAEDTRYVGRNALIFFEQLTCFVLLLAIRGRGRHHGFEYTHVRLSTHYTGRKVVTASLFFAASELQRVIEESGEYAR
jgi:hypothetical protein